MVASLIMSDVAGTSSPSSPRSTTTVFFDVDDTLFDHTFSVRAGLASLAGPFPAFTRHPLERLEDLYATELEAQHPRVLAGELTADEARLARFRILGRACGASDDDAGVQRIADTYRAAYLAGRRAVPGALELVRALRARTHRICV